jgi:hypothetical protein
MRKTIIAAALAAAHPALDNMRVVHRNEAAGGMSAS